MDNLAYEQYSYVIRNGTLSLDALKRIVKHDYASGWQKTPGSLARQEVIKNCENGQIVPLKLLDEPGDYLYGNSWPLPLHFAESFEEGGYE